MDREELSVILKNHLHWLYKNCIDRENMRADLSRIDLRGEDLRGVNLRHAELSYANLSGANLYGANLSGAVLCGADLSNADMSCTNLSFANLSYTNLSCTDLSGTDLHRANLYSAILSDTNLYCTNLYCTNLHDTNLCDAKNVPFIPYACPDFGMFIGYKKANGKIVELQIPEDAKRLSATGRNCRCDKAKVLGIYDYDHNRLEIESVASDRDKDFIYKVGEMVSVDDFDEDRWNEYSTGIHFYINFQEAAKY